MYNEKQETSANHVTNTILISYTNANTSETNNSANTSDL